MCELAATEVRKSLPETQISVSRVEAELAMKSKGPNYTAETLTHLKRHNLSGVKPIFLISSEIVSGADPEFSHWYKTDTILEIACIAVCPRPGYCINQAYISALTNNGGQFIVLDSVETQDISSTVLRQRLLRGEKPLELVRYGLIPLSIAQYLMEQGLYQNGEPHLAKPQFHH
jgi:nicotinic acid mononucleotide adenylyltransferase